jgi:hypothetical protein
VRQLCHVRIAIAGTVQRPRQRAFQQPFVANADGADVFGQLFVVDRDDELPRQPDGHFASSRSTFPQRFISFRATAICASKSGSDTVPTPSFASTSFGG